ncbi:hypothetical protein [Paenibacillus ginsengarvi]|uniref:DUF4190 domain-containing protein n=1 Tax=Paenibacillus ginsengarvi TaxID=400777 RepID=A0A3B0CTB9_9BACL|nr:hypothetical protein [Paenibacillus ginsengarvi]RKN86941.1 hypothetical protein D7M11_03020 [Paenibacillus ginsengarvi]
MNENRFDEYEEKGFGTGAEKLDNPNNREVRRNGSVEGFDEEFGAEVTPAAPMMLGQAPARPNEDLGLERADYRDTEVDDTVKGGQTVGWIGLVLAIASMFIYPGVMGTAAIILGVIAYMQGSRALGTWSAVLGGIALIAYYVLVPYYT